MSQVQVVYWRDIPAQVKVREGRTRVSRPLGPRFQEAIDAAAMRAGASATDDYLAEWRTSDPTDRPGAPGVIADAVASELESAYPPERLMKLAENGGRE